MPSTQFAVSSFSGVLVGAFSGMLTVLLCLLGKRIAEVIDEYFWLASNSMEF